MWTDPTRLLRLEGFALLAVALIAYGATEISWWLFAALILVPDLSMLAYARGPRFGARVYNIAHTSALPITVAGIGFLLANDTALAAGLVWVAHIGLDRAVGYGLKLPTSFHDTHLGRIGRGRPNDSRS